MAADPLRTRPLAVLLALAVAGGAGSPAGGQDVDVRVVMPANGQLVLADTMEVVLEWTLDLGPTRNLVVESQEIFVDTRSFRRLQQRPNASGPVSFRETVRSIDLLAGYDGDGVLDFRRQFFVRSPVGTSLFGTGTVSVHVIDPAVTVTAQASPDPLSVCRLDVIVTWTFETSASGLRVESSSGEISGGPRVPTSLVRNLGAGTSEIRERLAVPVELVAAAAGQRIGYSRDFDFKVGRFGAGRRRSGVRIGTVPTDFTVTAEPPAANVAVGQPATLDVTWTAAGFEDCRHASSPAGRFETLDGRPLGIVSAGLDLGFGSADETVRVPAQATLEASALGADRIRYVRQFSDLFGSSRSRGLSLELTGGIAAPFALTRLALQFRGGEVFRLVDQGEDLTATAEITYTGSGLLQAAWEVADPATTSGLPVFREIGLVRRRLSAGGELRLDSPVLPAELTGTHLVRLRIDDPATDFAEPPVLPYQVAEHAEIVSRVRPRPPADAPEVADDDPVAERELLVLSADREEARQLEQLGLEVKMRSVFDALDLVASVLRVPPGVTVSRLVDDLRRRHPTLWVDANHIYTSQSGAALPIDVGAVVATIGWGEEQTRCRSAIKIGIADSAVDQALPPGRQRSLLIPGELGSREHGTTQLNVLLELVPEAGDAVLVTEVLQRYEARTISGVYRDFVSLFRLAGAMDGLVREGAKLIQLGVAGRRSLILKGLVDRLEKRGVLIVAPFGSDPQRDAWPAAYDWVFGAFAGDVQAPALRLPDAVEVPAVDAACGNSCAVPFVAAALWVAGAGDAEVDREVLLKKIAEAQPPRVWRLRAPPCIEAAP